MARQINAQPWGSASRWRKTGVALLPLIGAILVVTLFLLLYNVLSIGVPPLQRLVPLPQGAESAKMLWGVSALCLTVALIWNLASSSAILWSSLAAVSSDVRKATLGVIIAVNLIGWVLLPYFDVGGAAADGILKSIATEVPAIEWITKCGNLLAFTTVSLVMFSICFLALPAPDLEVQAVAHRVRCFFFSLYSATALLVTGLLEVLALFRWGAAFHPSDGMQATATALAISAGAVFTVLLVAIYAPVALVQQRWLDCLVEKESQKTAGLDGPKWLAAHGFGGSPVGIVGAMLTPVLTGAAAQFLKLVG